MGNTPDIIEIIEERGYFGKIARSDSARILKFVEEERRSNPTESIDVRAYTVIVPAMDTKIVENIYGRIGRNKPKREGIYDYFRNLTEQSKFIPRSRINPRT